MLRVFFCYFFWNCAHFCSIQGKKIALFSGYIQLIFINKVHRIFDYEHYLLTYSILIFCMQYLQTFEENVIFAAEIVEVFTQTFASNVCKYCTQDLNRLHGYGKCSYSHMRCTLFYENWLDIAREKSISLPWIERSKKWAPFQKHVT